MRQFKEEEDLMVQLKPEFQNDLFSNLLKRFDRNILSQKLGKSESILYHYKNNRVNAIPYLILKRAANLLELNEDEMQASILRWFSAKENLKQVFKQGSFFRRKQLQENLSIKFGAYSLLKSKDNLFLDTSEWLNKNSWIEKLNSQKGFARDAKLSKVSEGNIEIKYKVYSRTKQKLDDYTVYLPKTIELNSDFCYFLGLLYGDGLSGARVGIINKDIQLITEASKLMRKYFQNNRIKAQISIYKNNPRINLDVLIKWLNLLADETNVYKNANAKGNYVFNIFITHNILKRIINDLLDNLEGLFSKLNFQQKGSLLAGFFDAEGNVNKLDRNLRFSQKIKNKVETIKNLLKKEGYHIRYDGSSIIIAFREEYKMDLELFKKQILPFLKHSEKTQEAKELIEGFLVRECYKPILKIILKSPNISSTDIAKKINKVKCCGKLLALYDAGFVKRDRTQVDESFKYAITDKGLEYLGEK
jgi:hypothetical protein